MNKLKLAFISLLSGIGLFATGYNDIDCMVGEYKYQIGQGTATNPIWTFTPFFSLPWWTAYVFSLLRIVMGSVLISISMFYLWLKVKEVNQ